MLSEDYKADALKNIVYSATSKIVSFAFAAAANIVLARNLTSDDYGIFGFASVFITFLSQFGDFGIGGAAIQKRELSDHSLHTCFTIKAILGIAICLISVAIAPLSQLFIENSVIPDVIRLLALNFVINIFAFMPSTLLTRDLKFKWLSVAQLIMSLANSLISIILAVNGFAYWSIVFANIASITVFTIALNIIKPVKLRFYFDKKLAMEFVQFSFHMYSLGVILLLMFNVDNFLIGALKGASVLGYYVIAFNWGSLACVIVGSVVASVLFPTFAKMQHDRGKLRIFVLETIEYVLLAVLFASGMLFLVSEEFFYYVLGRGSDKWMPALAALQVFCFYCAIRGASDAIGIVILALGDTKVLLKAASAILVVELTLIYPMLSNFGIEGVATVLVVSFIPAAFFYLPYYRKQLNITIGDLWLVIRAPLTAFLVLIVGALLIKSMKLLPLTLLSFGMKTVTGTVCFFLLCGFMTKWRFVRDIRALLKL